MNSEILILNYKVEIASGTNRPPNDVIARRMKADEAIPDLKKVKK